MAKPHPAPNPGKNEFQPYVPASESIAEFTIKSALAGVIFGILFGAANTYLGLRVGLTVSTSIPVAVMTVGLFRLTKRITGPISILESNMSQTIGSASSSLASGVIFTIPALFLWGMDPTLWQITGLALFGGLLGTLAMIPLRQFLIKQEHGRLPFPEGTACAKVLIASDTGGAGAANVFMGLGIGVVYKFLIGFLQLWKDEVAVRLPFIPKAEVGMATTPALLGVGYILGLRVAAVMVGGGLVSWVILIPLLNSYGPLLPHPLFPESLSEIASLEPSQIWSRYIRYIGAGAVAFGGVITVIRSIPTMIQSFRIGFGQIRSRLASSETAPMEAVQRTDRDLSFVYIAVGVAGIVALLGLIPGLFGHGTPPVVRLVAAPAIAVFAFFFVTVSSRIVGMVGVSSNPTSGMTIVTLLGVSMIFVLLGWTDAVGKATALMIGTVVCVAASVAGDMSQDLKTGYLVGATPNKQQIGELLGVITSAAAIGLVIAILNRTYTFGSSDLPAPQATLMKTIIEGVLQAGIPWGLILIGVGLGIVIELCSLPALPFAVGLYLPVSTMTPVFVGGCIRYYIEKKYRDRPVELEQRRESGTLFGSGLIGGEGLLGVAIAVYAFYYGKPPGVGMVWPSPWGEIVSFVLFLGLAYLLFRRAMRAD